MNTDIEKICPKDHVIDRSQVISRQLMQSEAWIDQLHHSYVEIQKTCATKDAKLEAAEAERDVLNGSWCANNITEGRGACGVCKTCLRSELESEKRRADESAKKQPINTHVRLFDLVRFMRSELHQAELITDEEYMALCAGPMALSHRGGSPSRQRLEDYDELAVKLTTLQAKLDGAKGALDKAPHHPPCRWFFAKMDNGRVVHPECTCWKSKALASLQPEPKTI